MKPLSTLPERLRGRIGTTDDGCWPWLGRLNEASYGVIDEWDPAKGRHRPFRVHRLVYEALVGPIVDGLTLDHLCHDKTVCIGGNDCLHRRCVNPAHLEPVTNAENLRRGIKGSARNAAKTHCPRGHPYDESNTYVEGGRRHCRTCSQVLSRINKQRRRQEALLRSAEGSP